MKPTNEERFWSKVVRGGPTDCWPWVACKNNGYGVFWVSETQKRIQAHRFSWMLFHDAEWPAGKIAMHSCNHPWCVNPLHIAPGEENQNKADAARDGLYPSGSRHWNGAKTHCPKGHEYTPENTRVRKNKKRCCKTCDRESSRHARNKRTTK